MPAKERPGRHQENTPNRRLYNTGTSSYVTLDDLAQMIRRDEEGLPFMMPKSG